MTYKKFIDELEKVLDQTVPPVPKPEAQKPRYRSIPDTGLSLVTPTPIHRGLDRPLEPWECVPALVLRWVTGYSSDGFSDHGQPEPNWDDLNKVLEHFCPDISYLKYKKLMALVRVDTDGETGYYGDSTSYALRILTLKSLYDFLNALIKPVPKKSNSKLREFIATATAEQLRARLSQLVENEDA